MIAKRTRAAALVRVSTAGQDLAAQKAEVEAWAGREGADVAWYEEEAVSGASRRRPVLDGLLADARKGRFEVLVVPALDRVARDVSRLVLALDELHAAGVELVSLREGFDFRGPMGRGMAALLGAVAEIERAAIRDRVRLGMEAARRRGVALGRPRFEPTEEELREIRELEAQGVPIREIAKRVKVFDANGRARTPSAAWVHRILRKGRRHRR